MEETTPATTAEEAVTEATEVATPAIDPAETQRLAEEYLQTLRNEQNLPLAIGASLAACLLGAAAWAGISYATEYQIGYMAVAIGLLVGFANRYAGKGIDQVYGVIGAVFAFVSCVLGNYLTLIAFTAKQTELGFFNLLSVIGPSTAVSALAESFQPMDILFYGLAIYEGYKFSFRQINPDEVQVPAQS